MEEDSFEPINRLLRVQIALMLRGKNEELSTLKQKVDLLDRLGLKATEIARILGRTPTHVSKELAGIRKDRK